MSNAEITPKKVEIAFLFVYSIVMLFLTKQMVLIIDIKQKEYLDKTKKVVEKKFKIGENIKIPTTTPKIIGVKKTIDFFI